LLRIGGTIPVTCDQDISSDAERSGEMPTMALMGVPIVGRTLQRAARLPEIIDDVLRRPV
jgi:hypothetical protein